jgi:hypothetical protein
MIKDLEKRKYKAMKRSDTDNMWIKIESLHYRYISSLRIWNEINHLILYYINTKGFWSFRYVLYVKKLNRINVRE